MPYPSAEFEDQMRSASKTNVPVVGTVTGDFGKFSFVAEREVPCQLSRSFLHQVDQIFLKEHSVYCRS